MATHQGMDFMNAQILSKNGIVLDEQDLVSLKCNYCSKFLRDPHQLLGCGHRFCGECVSTCVNIGSNPVCPVDNEPIESGDVKPDKACLREFSRLTGMCRSCNEWEGPLLHLEDHLLSCPLVDIPCDLGCGVTISRCKIIEHHTVCNNRTVQCIHCKEDVQLNSMEDHLDICDLLPVMCLKCKIQVPKLKLREHQLTLCPTAEVRCAFCSHQCALADMKEHYILHMFDMIKMVRVCEEKIKTLRDNKKSAQDSLSYLEEQTLNYRKQLSALQSKAKLVPELLSVIKQLQDQLSQAKMNMSSEKENNSLMTEEIKELGSRIVRMEQEMMIVKPSILEVQSTVNGFTDQMVGYVKTVQNVQESVGRHTMAMDELKLRQDLLDVKTVNGTFVWKIPQVNRRYNEALDRRTLSLYSPPFHSSPHGYRMCIRAYLNGDGSGKGTFVSVFFVMMRSEHDDLLLWPFKRPVTFELMNQSKSSNNIRETFMPDATSPSFQKPKAEMNVASGFPKFAKQSSLRDSNFCKDDSIFISCKVDTVDLKYE